jgi:hypothetical protein
MGMVMRSGRVRYGVVGDLSILPHGPGCITGRLATEDTENTEKAKERATDEHRSTPIKELAFGLFYRC